LVQKRDKAQNDVFAIILLKCLWFLPLKICWAMPACIKPKPHMGRAEANLEKKHVCPKAKPSAGEEEWQIHRCFASMHFDELWTFIG
jgi:hypothetical protein